MTTWISDNNGNKCSVEYFGTEEEAQKALDSLENCRNCINCVRCYDCSDCTDCSGIHDCTNCKSCSDCSNCSDGTDCSGCHGCSHCSNCSNCSNCTSCSNCTACTSCTDRSGSSGKRFNNNVDGFIKFPVVPIIDKIHSKVFEFASAEGALEMGVWHEDGFCGTTHCRAGIVTHLAGEEGRKLEEFWGCNHAAWLIYKASDPEINGRPDFFCSNEAALADMKRLAELELAYGAALCRDRILP